MRRQRRKESQLLPDLRVRKTACHEPQHVSLSLTELESDDVPDAEQTPGTRGRKRFGEAGVTGLS
jgi:hypothetical protein